MNSCILMAEIIKEPELRYTPDNQTQIAEMLVQFPGPGPNDGPGTLRVVGWGNLAQEIHQQYHLGDRVIIEGRLNINTVERKEGFKEKRAELTAQRIYSLQAEVMNQASPAARPPATVPTTTPNNVVPLGSRSRSASSPPPAPPRPAAGADVESTEPIQPSPTFSPQYQPVESDELDNPDYDPIPF